MSNIRRRIKTVEKKLSINEERIVVEIAHYGGELPPDRTDGNITVHYVMYDGKAKQ